MSELDLRIVRPGDDSDEGMLADVSAPLWRLWVVFDGTEDAKAIAAFFGELNEGQRNLLAVAISFAPKLPTAVSISSFWRAPDEFGPKRLLGCEP